MLDFHAYPPPFTCCVCHTDTAFSFGSDGKHFLICRLTEVVRTRHESIRSNQDLRAYVSPSRMSVSCRP